MQPDDDVPEVAPTYHVKCEGVVAPFALPAHRHAIDAAGTLTLYFDGRPIYIFAPGVWRSVEILS